MEVHSFMHYHVSNLWTNFFSDDLDLHAVLHRIPSLQRSLFRHLYHPQMLLCCRSTLLKLLCPIALLFPYPLFLLLAFFNLPTVIILLPLVEIKKKKKEENKGQPGANSGVKLQNCLKDVMLKAVPCKNTFS